MPEKILGSTKAVFQGDNIMINKNKLGLVFGAFLGAWHFVWVWLVFTGVAQSLMDWIFRIHFIEPPYAILPFKFGDAIALIAITSITGYLSGWFLGAVWNWLRADTSSHGSVSAVRHPATGH
jgi:hypothetical protein